MRIRWRKQQISRRSADRKRSWAQWSARGQRSVSQKLALPSFLTSDLLSSPRPSSSFISVSVVFEQINTRAETLTHQADMKSTVMLQHSVWALTETAEMHLIWSWQWQIWVYTKNMKDSCLQIKIWKSADSSLSCQFESVALSRRLLLHVVSWLCFLQVVFIKYFVYLTLQFFISFF